MKNGPNPIPNEMIAEIRKLRRDSCSYLKIGRLVGCSDVTARKYAKDIPLPVKIACRDCGQQLPAHANFCFMCGAKVMTERELLIGRLSDLCGCFNLMPESARDSAIKTLNDTIRYLEKESE